MNVAGVCLVVVCVLYSFSEGNIMQAFPTPQLDRGKTSSYFEDSDIFKQTSSVRGFFALKDQKDPELSFPSNLCDDSECLLIRIDCVPNIIEKKKSVDRLNQLFGKMRAFDESEVSTPETEQEHDGFDPLKVKRGVPDFEFLYWMGDVRSVQKIFDDMRGKKSQEYVGEEPHISRGKKEFHEYEKMGELRNAQQIANGLKGKKSEEFVGDEFDPSSILQV